MTSTAATSGARPSHPGLLARTIQRMSTLVVWLVLALAFSIVTEWIGMTWIWPDEGVLHSERMLARELEHLDADFRASVVTAAPVAFATATAEALDRLLFERTGAARAVRWVTSAPGAQDSRARRLLRLLVVPALAYVQAARNTVKVFGTRVAVLVLAMPAFVLLGIVGFTDGLVERDLRRWSGGRESAFLYHHAKRTLLPSVVGAWVLYLAWPVSVHPSYVILPFATLFAAALALTGSTFKKYL